MPNDITPTNDNERMRQALKGNNIEARLESLRALEALLFASATPLTRTQLQDLLPDCDDLETLLSDLVHKYAHAGFVLEQSDAGYGFRTAPDLAHLFNIEQTAQKPLSRAAMEVLSIIAYHQPATRAEIEQVRGVATSKGTLDVLLQANLVRMRGRRDAPGKPLTYGTTPHFLDYFGLKKLRDLPGLDDLKAAGLLSTQLPPDFVVPQGNDDEALADNEIALEEEIFDASTKLRDHDQN